MQTFSPYDDGKRSRAMSRVKTKDGPLEVAVRSALHRKGYRFRKHIKALPGSPDVIFTKRKIAILIDGDFWHGYDFDSWKEKLKPFWREKVETNVTRDKKKSQESQDLGWLVLRFWGHEVKKNLSDCVEKIEFELAERKLST